MGIDVSWLDKPGRVLLWAFEDGWTAADIEAATRLSTRLSDSGLHPVDTILDFSRAAHAPDSLTSFYGKLSRYAAGSRIIVAIGGQGFLRVALGVFSSDYRHLFFADSREEALSLIQRQAALTRDQIEKASQAAWLTSIGEGGYGL